MLGNAGTYIFKMAINPEYKVSEIRDGFILFISENFWILTELFDFFLYKYIIMNSSLSFENNAAVCSLYYSQMTAVINNCTLTLP